MEETERAMFRLEATRIVASVMEGNTPEAILAESEKFAAWILTGDLPKE
jgi:hypothetical protein